ncbi:CapA family protein [Aneurinibacillus thermoaerophilus]|uniref:CapA family protein n=2 Tax=Aneurinibacillus thermoaerophilus TaxID=143495 RepID=UPI002E24C211|nr:CapA family protein [Aneurinibacillus thermoaerophilus]
MSKGEEKHSMKTYRKYRFAWLAAGILALGLLAGGLMNVIADAKTKNADVMITSLDRVTLAFTGDLQFTGTVAEQIKKNGTSYPFTDVKPILARADIAVGNLETTLTTRGAAQNKQFTFRSDPRMAQAMADSGYDLVGLANNHTMDFGQDSLLDTIKHLQKAKLIPMGAGKNLTEATQIHYITKRGKTIAFLNYSRVLPSTSWMAGANKPGLASAYNPKGMYSKVREARKNADMVIVFIHWGKERMTVPEAYQTEMGHKLVDAGADLVVGHHSHIMQPVEWYKGKLIAYSLGNFVFTKSKMDLCNQTAILEVALNGKRIQANLVPAHIINGRPRLMTGAEKASFLNFIDRISPKATVKSDGTIVPSP